MVRNPAVAGQFYPLSASEVTSMLSSFEKKAGVVKEKPLAVVVPHAGWIYSGLTAMHSFLALKNAAKTNPCFTILCPNHYGFVGKPIALSMEDWKTPLGEAKNNKELGKSLLQVMPLLEESEDAHSREHSLEVQLPFLQYLFKDFSFTPICLGDQSKTSCEELGKAITSAAKKEANHFVIASSDFTHYEPAATARQKDLQVIDEILKLDVNGFYAALEETGASVCGYGAIACAMTYARERGAKKGVLLDFSNSGDASGDYGAVVDYAAIAFV